MSAEQYLCLAIIVDIFITALYAFYLEIIQRAKDGTWKDSEWR